MIMMKLFTVILQLLIIKGCLGAWLNNWDGLLEFECPAGGHISRWKSQHHNGKEDRQFDLECGTGIAGTSCYWSDFVNGWDAYFDFSCQRSPKNHVLSGVISYHNNNVEDRRFRFKCCRVMNANNAWRPPTCKTFGWLPSHWDRPVDLQLGSDRAIHRLRSYHDNPTEDRKFEFHTCQYRKCSVSAMHILDNVTPNHSGEQVVGLVTSQTCSSTGSFKTVLARTDSVEEHREVTTSDGGSFTFNTEISVTATTSVKFLGSGSSLTFGLSQNLGGSRTWSKDDTKSTSTGSSSSVEGSWTYSGPGAVMLFAITDKYTFEYDNVRVRYTLQCHDGSTFQQESRVKLSATTYGHTRFYNRFARFNSGRCGTASDACLANIDGTKTTVSELNTEFSNCFSNGVGTVSKK